MKYNFDEIISRKNTNAQNVEGWRSYIFKCGPDEVFPYADDEFIRMWVADMEFAVAPEIRQAIKDRVDKMIFGYTIISDDKYYKTFSKWCKDRYDWTFNYEELVYSPGVIPAIYQIVEDIVKPNNGKALTMTPAYGYFSKACVYNDVELVCSPLKLENGRFTIDFEDLAAKAKDPDIRMLILCNPHNPTGRMWTEDELKKVAEIARENNLWLFSDEIHCDLIRTGRKHIPMGKVMPDYQRLITAMSASKTFNLAGFAFSDIIIRDPEERKRFVARDKTIGAINPLSLAAHTAAYEKAGGWLDELKVYLDESFSFVKDFLEKNIPEAVMNIPEATYLAWVDFRKALPDIKDLALFFANNAGVLLEGGNSLFVNNAEGFVRLNLAMPRSLIAEGLKRMAAAIEAHKKTL